MSNDSKNSTVNHKVLGKNYYNKRKKMTCVNAFVKFRDVDGGKRLHKKFCESNDNPELNVRIEEVDMTLKKTTDWTVL